MLGGILEPNVRIALTLYPNYQFGSPLPEIIRHEFKRGL